MTGPGASLEGATFGPWALQRRIGGGGLGEVYLAERAENPPGAQAPDTSLVDAPADRPVAIKIMRPPASDTLTQTVLAESARAQALRAAHVIPLYGSVEHAGRAGVVMAYAPGGSLADALARRTASGYPAIPLPMRSATAGRLITQIGQALAGAHAAGLAHGDVKPSNIFIRRSSRGGLLAALSDFGQGDMVPLAAQLVSSNAPAAQEPWILDRFQFTAPERLAGAPADPASDQYSLAAVAYYLITGRPPRAGDARALLARAAVGSAEILEPSALLPEAPEGLDSILLRGLDTDPTQRYGSVESFVRDLASVLATAPGSSGVTQEFSRLSGQRTLDGSNPAQRAPRRPPQSDSTNLPDEPPSAMWRALALATAAATLIAIVTCGVGLFALNSAGVRPRAILANFQGPNAVATERSAERPLSPEAVAANQQLRAVVAQAPLFTDNLTSNQRQWQVSGGQMSFTNAGLDLVSQNVAQPATANIPTTLTASEYAGQVTMRFESGESGDLAGMRFFVTDTGAGGQEYYAFFLAPNGEYYLWFYHDGWRYLAGGYADAIKPGVDVANTLGFITHSAAQTVTIYVNGSYIATVPLQAGGPTGGGAGLIILSTGVEARFSNLSIYPAPR
ncbi:MAG TPA: serine/threonine-protein kinase [Ktedonobacterales bacterium]